MKDRFIVKEMGEEGVMVYDQKRDEIHFLNPVAYLIWTLSKEKKPLSEIEKALRKRFRTESDKDIFLDIDFCLQELREKELLSISSQNEDSCLEKEPKK